jgi:hypothetical protein
VGRGRCRSGLRARGRSAPRPSRRRKGRSFSWVGRSASGPRAIPRRRRRSHHVGRRSVRLLRRRPPRIDRSLSGTPGPVCRASRPPLARPPSRSKSGWRPSSAPPMPHTGPVRSAGFGRVRRGVRTPRLGRGTWESAGAQTGNPVIDALYQVAAVADGERADPATAHRGGASPPGSAAASVRQQPRHWDRCCCVGRYGMCQSGPMQQEPLVRHAMVRGRFGSGMIRPSASGDRR